MRQRVSFEIRRGLTRRWLRSHSLSLRQNRTAIEQTLSSTQLEVVSDVKTRYEKYKLTNTDSRIRVSTFLQAVFVNDFQTAVESLQSLRERCGLGLSSLKNVDVFYSCSVMFLTHLLHVEPFTLNSSQAKNLVAALESLPASPSERDPAMVRELHYLMVLVLLRVLRGHSSAAKVLTINLISFIRALVASLGLEQTKILEKVQQKRPQLLAQYNQLFGAEESVRADTNEIENEQRELFHLINGSQTVSYNMLCQFIELSSFDASSFGPGKKFYEIYEQLGGEEKARFWKAYLEHNYKKQLVIEEHSQHVFKSMTSQGALQEFKMAHRAWIDLWLKETVENLQKVAELDRDYRKFAFIYARLTYEKTCSMVLSHMLSTTVPSGSTKVFYLTSRVARAIKIELRKQKQWKHVSRELENHLSHESLLDFAAGIIKVFVDSCELPSLLGGHDVFTLVTEREVSSPKTYGVIRVHPRVSEQFQIYRELFQTGFYHLPMLHPPRHWTSPTDGGFLSNQVPLVTSSEPETTLAYMEKAHKTGQLASVYQTLNALGNCAWTINPFTADVFNALLASKDMHPALPASLGNLGVKPEPEPTAAEYTCDSKFEEAHRKWSKHARSVAQKHSDAQNLRVYYELVSKLAQSFAKNGEVLFLPHHMDFRGRVYPAVSFLSHQSEDLVRSLLMFWEAKPLGSAGLSWLEYQLASLYNPGKLTHLELARFVAKNRENIIESARNPMLRTLWWLQADNPWQSLALCKEFDSIWKFKGEISLYRTRIPIHQDGSCNGLQHYAALGGDQAAAKSVNVLPSENRQDVYLTVLDLVKKQIDSDTTNPDLKNFAEMARLLLSRKLVKQTVMTTVYGVTQYGATEQILARIDDLQESGRHMSIAEDVKPQIAAYIARTVLSSISELFAGAKRIQNWLLDVCTRCLSAYDADENGNINFSLPHYRPMMWTSLSGFPVFQLYRKRPRRAIKTPLQVISVKDSNRLAAIDAQKSKNGVAPNFIHSIDAIHLMMTCVASQTAQISFAAIHDSFWTHPSDVPRLSKLIREEFVRLHSSGIMESLSEDLRYVNRNSFQLVWVDNKEHPEFASALKKLRKTYVSEKSIPDKTLSTTVSSTRRDTILRREMSDYLKVAALVNEYKPTLLFKTHANQAIEYGETQSKPFHAKVSQRTHTILLVPVIIPRAPQAGAMDITKVLDSQHFFS